MGLHHVLCIYVGILMGILVVGVGVSLTLLPTLGTHLLLLECFVQSLYECLVLFCNGCLFFLKGNQEVADLGKSRGLCEPGRVEVGKLWLRSIICENNLLSTKMK